MQNQRHIAYSACVIGAGFVKGKVNRPEQIDDQPGYLEPENGTPCMNQKSAKDAFLFQIQNDIPGPQKDGRSHRHIIGHGIRIKQFYGLQAVENAP